ncbi:hypothetical protein PhCBS80983_g05645 [Powellomyces hirtus]|uniref:RNI-like protein n=1 Tax=Powellomyces hirtus TaxID=109895 RepID=A0A507DU32_9FUNG|nr:hypothetical protein PhCBS80983_g05645 [Powellomyces hirtus]
MGGKKGISKPPSKKQKEADLVAASLQRTQRLKDLRTAYTAHCRLFVTEPQPLLVRRIDGELRNPDGPEEIDKLILSQLHLAPNDVYSMTTTFNAYAALSGIYLWRAKVESKGLEALAGFVSTHATITTLHLLGCHLTASAATHIATIARTAAGLHTLVVDHNPLGSAGIAAVFAGVRAHRDSRLVKASCRYCDAGPPAAESIAVALAENRTIVELQLDGNFLGDAGLEHLARHLAHNTTLQTLCLAANQIRNASASGGVPAAAAASYLTPHRKSNANSAPTTTTTTTSTDQQPLYPAPASLPPPTPLAAFCTTLATTTTTLSFLDLRGNHIGNTGADLVLDMLLTRKSLLAAAAAAAAAPAPLLVYVTERMSEDRFERIWDLNDAMAATGKKGKGAKKGNKK